MFAGEIIFSLPFQIPRFFRPTLLQVFDLSNAELGDIFAIYGVTAMEAYFPGGVIADRYSPRKLMAISLVATALGRSLFGTNSRANWTFRPVWLLGSYVYSTILGGIASSHSAMGGSVGTGKGFCFFGWRSGPRCGRLGKSWGLGILAIFA